MAQDLSQYTGSLISKIRIKPGNV
ncbi:hypothetical protein BN12_4030014 [Nostocoides japonicum T1-X7]|uniref:Uncharacterized protein n=1 Tax=Nostocoides japonicum T1-X7 TaxID=1194083 RepID=A0A077M4W2_9MICO|nr:hypothetical protein BN12_4030014 [Tetrasphaera japonica T1-X7]